MLCCLSQISSRAVKSKRANITIKRTTMPITYNKAKSGGVGGMLKTSTPDILICTMKEDK